MKAYRARAAEVCVRLEPKTMTTLDSIADEIGYTRNELMQSMVKFGLTNRDWRNEGLTAHKRLPRYQENPMATKPPSAAQLAARARFAEMARSGVLNRKRQIAAKKRAANPVKKSLAVSDETIYKRYRIVHGRGVYYITREGHNIGSATTLTEAKAIIDMLTEGQPNPRKKTVSQKISQLVHEGYPQRQAVAVALNEQRAGKVKRNPAKATMIHAYAVICKDERLMTWHTVALTANKSDAVEIAQLLADSSKKQYAVQARFVHEKDFEVY